MIVFNKKEFIELNKHKCSEVYHLDFNGISIIFGEKDKELYSPFSAPFGGFFTEQTKPSLKTVENATEKLYEWLKEKNKKCHITLPPPIYGETLISQSFYCLLNKGFSIEYTDINYSLNLSKTLQPKPKFYRDLKVALKENLVFKKCENNSESRIAYDIISNNRKERGYSQHLSFEELCRTSEVCKIDSFLLYLNETPIAGAVVYITTQNIAQLILLGDNRKYSKTRPMNLFAMRLAEYYKHLNFSYFDLGPSSKNGIPNYGLSHFKSQMGCDVTLKHTLVL